MKVNVRTDTETDTVCVKLAGKTKLVLYFWMNGSLCLILVSFYFANMGRVLCCFVFGTWSTFRKPFLCVTFSVFRFRFFFFVVDDYHKSWNWSERVFESKHVLHQTRSTSLTNNNKNKESTIRQTPKDYYFPPSRSLHSAIAFGGPFGIL